MFPKRSTVPFGRLSKAVQQGLKALRHKDYDHLCAELEDFLGEVGCDLEAMSKREYTIFRHLHRLWLGAARRFTNTLVHWGKAATIRDSEGVLPCRMAGGNLNEVIYTREHPETLPEVIKRANRVIHNFMALGLDGYGQDVERAQAEGDAVLVKHLRKSRAYLKSFDGRLKAPLQDFMNMFRQYITYEACGEPEVDILGLSPLGRWELEEYRMTHPTTEEDYDQDYDDEVQD